MIPSIPMQSHTKPSRLWFALGIGLCLQPHFGCQPKPAKQPVQNAAPISPNTAQNQASPREDTALVETFQREKQELEEWKKMRMKEIFDDYHDELVKFGDPGKKNYMEASIAKVEMENAQRNGNLQQARMAQNKMISYVNRAIELKQMQISLPQRKAMAEAIIARQAAGKMIEISQKYLRFPSLSTYQNSIAKANEDYQKAEAEAKRVETEEYPRWVMEYKAQFGLQ